MAVPLHGKKFDQKILQTLLKSNSLNQHNFEMMTHVNVKFVFTILYTQNKIYTQIANLKCQKNSTWCLEKVGGQQS